MKKILVFAATVLFALPSFGQSDYIYRLRSLYELLQVKSRHIVFLGDSITNGGEWEEITGNKNAVNRGISGDRAVWLADRLDPIVEGKPKKLFLMIGTNDLSAGIPIEEIVESIAGVIERFETESPKTKIYVQSVFPVDVAHERYAKAQDRNEKILELNRQIESLCLEKSLPYIDVHSALKDETGNLRKDVSNDGLHLMGKGYMIWKDIIAPYVK